MPKKSEKHTPVVISECCASADNWLRFKVMCDLTLIHNSTRGLHTRVNKAKSKAEELLTVRLTLEIGSGPPNEKESLHFCRQTLTHVYRDRHLSQRGLGLHFNPICFCHPSILTCLLCQLEIIFFFPNSVSVL